MRSVCIIPARGGSKRIPRKNLRPFFGRPIIAYSIETAIESGAFSDVIVSTDDDEIAEVAQRYGANVLKRRAALAADDVGTQEVMADAMGHVGPTYHYACCLYATAPLLTVDNVSHCLYAVHGGKRAFAMTVGAEPLRDAGACYTGTWAAFKHRLPLIYSHTAMIPLPEHRICDINTEDDWQRAERMYAALHGLETK